VNVNADEAACAIAAALAAERLLLLTDVDGVRVGGVRRLDVAAGEVELLVARGEVTGGMIPKLRAAAQAVARGVSEVRIAGFDGASLAGVGGTRVRAAGARPAARGAEKGAVHG
jgi:acetylglutamate kinase